MASGSSSTSTSDSYKPRYKFKRPKIAGHKIGPKLEFGKRRILPQKRVFGTALDKESSQIPEFIPRALIYLEHHATTEGIFRISGATNIINDLKKRLNEGEIVDFEGYDPHVVAGLVKLYFRELPEPLLTFELYDMFLGAHSVPERTVRLAKIRNVLEYLPESYRTLLRELCVFLSRIAEHSETNFMGAENLALVFAPNLLRPKGDSVSVAVEDFGPATSLMTTLIVNHEQLLSTEELVEAMYDYPPADSTELPLQAGGVVRIIMKRQDGWFYGEAKGRAGFFPSNYTRKKENDNDNDNDNDNNNEDSEQ